MAEKKYIDRDTLINDFESDLIIRMFDNLKGTPRPKTIDIADVIKRIEEFPIEDVVEVVRCKDCKYSNTISCPTYIDNLNGDDTQILSGNDYCSRGERRGNDDDRQ